MVKSVSSLPLLSSAAVGAAARGPCNEHVDRPAADLFASRGGYYRSRFSPRRCERRSARPALAGCSIPTLFSACRLFGADVVDLQRVGLACERWPARCGQNDAMRRNDSRVFRQLKTVGQIRSRVVGAWPAHRSASLADAAALNRLHQPEANLAETSIQSCFGLLLPLVGVASWRPAPNGGLVHPPLPALDARMSVALGVIGLSFRLTVRLEEPAVPGR